MKGLFSRKSQPRARQPSTNYQHQAAYHYSAKRSNVDRLLDRGVVDEPVAAPKDRKRLLRLAVGLVVVCGLVYSLLLGDSARVYFVGQATLRNPGDYQQKTDDILIKSIKNRTKLFINRHAIADELQKTFPEVASASVTTPIFAYQPHVELQLSQPALILATGGRTYLVDQEGRALFDTMSDKPLFDTSKLPIVQDEANQPVETGERILTGGVVNFIHELRIQSEAKNLSLESVILRSGGGEVDLRFVGLAYYVKFNVFEQARPSFGTFIAAKQKLEQESAKPAEYIDVRIPERAYVK